MKTPTLVVLVLVLPVLFTGCSTIREVKKVPGKGGEITLTEGLGGDARLDAKQKMRENCGKKTPFILEEGEAVVGATTHHATPHPWSISSDTEDKREWRIRYKCKKKKT